MIYLLDYIYHPSYLFTKPPLDGLVLIKITYVYVTFSKTKPVKGYQAQRSCYRWIYLNLADKGSLNVKC